MADDRSKQNKEEKKEKEERANLTTAVIKLLSDLVRFANLITEMIQ
jgi:hypothetical protein